MGRAMLRKKSRMKTQGINGLFAIRFMQFLLRDHQMKTQGTIVNAAVMCKLLACTEMVISYILHLLAICNCLSNIQKT
jgi:hypothetical protein